MRRSLIIVFFLVTLLIVEFVFTPACFAIDANAATQAINQAELDLDNAYVNVSVAADAGANVSALLDKLNSAGTYLSEANVSFTSGNYDKAASLAADCSTAVQGVAEEATKLRSYAEEEHINTVFWAVFVSAFGVFLVAILGFLGWGFLKKRYSREILKKRPRVVDIREL
jgi:hypothetical protein